MSGHVVIPTQPPPISHQTSAVYYRSPLPKDMISQASSTLIKGPCAADGDRTGSRPFIRRRYPSHVVGC